MCSTPDARIALLGQAIDELAADTRTGTQSATAQTTAQSAGTESGGTESAGTESGGVESGGAATEMDGVAERLARIWAMVAELDPGLAECLPRYAAPAD